MPDLYDAIVVGDAKKATEVTKAALEAGTDVSELLQKQMIPAMAEEGERFERNGFFVPELLIAARAMKQSMELLAPLLAAAGAEPAGRVVIGTVQGDLHDIGKNLVASMLEGGGFEVVDLGVDVSSEKFVDFSEDLFSLLGLSSAVHSPVASVRRDKRKKLRVGMRPRSLGAVAPPAAGRVVNE